jgi:hypothetical protein
LAKFCDFVSIGLAGTDFGVFLRTRAAQVTIRIVEISIIRKILIKTAPNLCLFVYKVPSPKCKRCEVYVFPPVTSDDLMSILTACKTDALAVRSTAMADLIESPKPVQAQADHSWPHSLSEYYHAGLKLVGLEPKEEPKILALKKFDFEKIRDLNPPGEMLIRYDFYDTKSAACAREFFSKALPDPKHIDVSCFKELLKDKH